MSLSGFNFTVPFHTVTVVEVQGTWTTPFMTSTISLNAGERISFLLRANNPGCYEIDFQMYSRAEAVPLLGPGIMYLNYAGQNCGTYNTTYKKQFALDANFLDVSKLTSLTQGNIPSSTRRVTISVQQRHNANGSVWWTVNDISGLFNQQTPFLVSAYYDIPEIPVGYILDVNKNEVIDLLFVNLPRWDNVTEQHPLHLHGHRFWVLGTGTGIAPTGTQGLNINNPISVDTWILPKNGWAILRFVADNPGVWLGHCHVSFHLPMGMFFFMRYPRSTIPAPPEDFPLYCGSEAALEIIRRANGSSSLEPSFSLLFGFVFLCIWKRLVQ